MRTKEEEAERIINAAHAAIRAAASTPGGSLLPIDDLISGLLSIYSAIKSETVNDREHVAKTVTISLVELVGRRRMHELVDKTAAAGAGRGFE